MIATDRCLNCGELTTGKVYNDELGPFMVCGACESSFDTDAFYQVVTGEEATAIIENRKPLGLFAERLEGGKCVGIDNTTGNAWTEEFDDEAACSGWLSGKIEIGDERDE